MAEMRDFPSNSEKSKRERIAKAAKEPLKKVTTGNVSVKKKSELAKFADTFLAQDLATVKDYLFNDVLVPNLKTAIVAIIKNGVDMIFWGDASGNNDRNRPYASRVSYENKYVGRPNTRREDVPPRDRGILDYDNVSFTTREDANAVLTALEDAVSQYNIVSVADFFDVAGITITTRDYPANKYGWADLHTASIVRNRDGSFGIRFPRAIPID